MMMPMKKPFNYSIPILVLCAVLAAGCGSKTKKVAILDDEDIRLLANIESSSGNAQAGIEIIPVPQIPQNQLSQSMPLPEVTVQNSIAVQTAQPVSAAAEIHETTTAISEKYTFEQKVQIALQNANLYSGAIDGKIGPKTREAIKQFQISKGLNADGLAGKQTWAALREQYYKE